MKRLSHVAFTAPIPIPGTHVRESTFLTIDGWSIEDDDGRITLERGETRFYTYVSASCVEDLAGSSTQSQAPEQSGPQDVGSSPTPPPIPLPFEPKAGKRKRNA